MCWVYLANVSNPFQLGGLSTACSPISAQYQHIKLEKDKHTSEIEMINMCLFLEVQRVSHLLNWYIFYILKFLHHFCHPKWRKFQGKQNRNIWERMLISLYKNIWYERGKYIFAKLVSPAQCHGTALQCCQSEDQHPDTPAGG